jgi:hypothetical protein
VGFLGDDFVVFGNKVREILNFESFSSLKIN